MDKPIEEMDLEELDRYAEETSRNRQLTVHEFGERLERIKQRYAQILAQDAILQAAGEVRTLS